MFVSTTLPTFALRALPVRYGARNPYARGSFVRNSTPAVTGSWANGAYALTADLPGVPDDAVAVSVAGRTLTIDVATDELTWSERLRLPQTLDPEQVSARYENGRLTVTIAKVAEAAPRTISIDTTPARAELVAAEAPVAQAPADDASTATSVTV